MLNATNRRCIPVLLCFDDDDRCLHVVCHNDLRLEGAHIPHVLTMKVGAGQTHDGTRLVGFNGHEGFQGLFDQKLQESA